MPTGTRKARPSSIMVKFRAGMQSNMPVRSLNSCVLRWPDRNEVDRAMRLWTAEQVRVADLRLSGSAISAHTLGATGGWAVIWMSLRSSGKPPNLSNAVYSNGISQLCRFRRKSSSTLCRNGKNWNRAIRVFSGCSIVTSSGLSRCIHTPPNIIARHSRNITTKSCGPF